MTVQVFYKNKPNLDIPSLVALFADEKFQVKNTGSFFTEAENSYIQSQS